MSNTKPTLSEYVRRASYADIFLNFKDAIFLLSPVDFKILDCNFYCEDFLKVPHDQLIGQGLEAYVTGPYIDTTANEVLDQMAADEKKKFSQRLRKSLRNNATEFETRIKTFDGEFRDVMIMTARIFYRDEQSVLEGEAESTDGSSDKPDLVQIIARDITEMKEAQRQLALMATTDGLTKIENKRRFLSRLEEIHENAQRYSQQYALIFFDLDNFKHYNDRNGHPAGDDLLRDLATLLKKEIRKTDFPARYGGEEFVVLCPNIDTEGATILAERIRSSIEKHPFAHASHQPKGYVSASIGVASFPNDAKTPSEMIEFADQATYYSKKTGRNRVTHFELIRTGKVPPLTPKAA